ncbi:EAL domain-containing protein [Sulfurimonas sp.]|uniref:EAL domain-containing protein n=1 Tax=Sulfurimonas sp. TaxID=2022749 RepID=UPI002AB0BF52|nr:EAL domain-containing protein [Sulfurimonas sp.]
MIIDLHKDEIKTLLNKLPGMLYRCKYNNDWTMEFISDGCKELTGYENKELLFSKDITYASIIHEDDATVLYDIVTQALNDKKAFNYEYRINTKNGEFKWVWEQGLGIYDEEGNVLHIEGFITDITSQKIQKYKLKKELYKKNKELLINLSLLNEYKKAVDESAIVTKTNVEGFITYVNDEFCRISGYSRKEVLGRSHNIIRHPQNPNKLFKNLWKTILDKRIWKGVIKNRSKTNKTYYVKSIIIPILDYDGEIKEFMAIRHDVTDLILQEKKIKFQTTDQMTHLPNRQKLMEDLMQDKKFKLAIINIEKFKEINEYYGFDIGDRLLIELSSLLSKHLKPYKTKLYKLPSDEFAILVDEKTNKDDLKKLILVILKLILKFNFKIDGNKFNIRAISGVSMQRDYLINAEMATNHAKISNKKLVFFDENLDIKDQLVNNVKWTNKIKQAIKKDRIVVFTQAIVCNTTHKINKYECLVRMIDTDGTIISPMKFLTIAKRSRLYSSITKIVIKKAIEYFKDKDDHFSINFTLEDILNPDTVNYLVKKINKHDGLGHRLIIEIVEDEGIENYEEVNEFIKNMRFLGCKIAIDDFGTGYSNFYYLMRLNVDFIKIDGSIIKNIAHDKNAKVVAELIVGFAKRLNIATIGEFVYNEEILNIVKKMGLDYSQGFFLGKPKQIEL